MPLYDFKCELGHGFERFVRLADFDNPQHCDCGAEAKRMISAPMVISDTIEPTRGPDGRMHESRKSFQASCEPDGNPKGEKYHILAPGEDMKAPPQPEFCKKKRREDVQRTIKDIEYGRIPTTPTGVTA